MAQPQQQLNYTHFVAVQSPGNNELINNEQWSKKKNDVY